MKKRILIIICLFAVLSCTLVLSNRKCIEEFFWQIIDERLDYERSLEVGDDFNKISWVNLYFQINHHKDGNNFEYVNADSREKYILLKNISSYKILDSKLYINSHDGCAVIDDNSRCRIFLNDNNLSGDLSDYTNDLNGNKVYKNKILRMDNIVYLSKFEEFDDAEKEVFKKFLK